MNFLSIIVVAGVLLTTPTSTEIYNYLYEDLPIYENVNEQIEWTDLMLSDIELPQEVINNADRYIDHIVIEPKIIEKEMCKTHDTIHRSFDEIDDTCIDVQFYERDYSRLNSILLNFKDGTGYYWGK